MEEMGNDGLKLIGRLFGNGMNGKEWEEGGMNNEGTTIVISSLEGLTKRGDAGKLIKEMEMAHHTP
jgi:hypothetical protein